MRRRPSKPGPLAARAPRVHRATGLVRPNYTAQAVEKLRPRIEADDEGALLSALQACLYAGVAPLSPWLVEKLVPFVDRLMLGGASNVHSHKQLAVQRRNQRLRAFVVHRVLQLDAEGEQPRRARFARVAEELRAHHARDPKGGDGKATSAKVETIFDQSESRVFEKFFKALKRPPSEKFREHQRFVRLHRIMAFRAQKR